METMKNICVYMSCSSSRHAELHILNIYAILQYGHSEAGGVEHIPPGWSYWVGLVSLNVHIICFYRSWTSFRAYLIVGDSHATIISKRYHFKLD